MNYQLLLAFSGLCSTGIGFSQQNAVASGGDASGSGGKVSYTIGQIDYGSLSGASGTMTEGVQQPFEIFEIVGLGETSLDISATLFPNPAATSVVLSMEASQSESTTFRLSDASGRLVRSGGITGKETQIDLQNLPDACYYLDVMVAERLAKSFKLIKND